MDEKYNVELTAEQMNVVINGMSLILSLNRNRTIELSKIAERYYKEVKQIFEQIRQ